MSGAKAIDSLAAFAPRRVGRISERLIALALALVLLRSAFAHLGNPYYFLSSIYSYQIVGLQTGKVLGAVLPFLQIVAAVCVLLRRWAREAYALTAIMFLVFAAAQIIAMRRGLEIPCGCFGASESLHVGPRTLVVAAVALAAAVAGWILIGMSEIARGNPGPVGDQA